MNAGPEVPRVPGPVALITGAGSGIGRAIALGLAARGMRLCLVGRRPGPLADTARAAGPLEEPARIHGTDLSSEADVRALALAVAREPGVLDILVHCAGAIRLGRTDAALPADLDGLYQVNVRGPYLLTQLLLPLLRERQGHVVFINSSAGLQAGANAGQYGATKHALRAVADALREEVNREGIRVTSVYVGRTATPMQAAVHAAEGRAYHPERLLQPEDVAVMVAAILSLPRSAEVTDLRIRPACAPVMAASPS